ncbi:uncharacterized protein [Watersipora subatra]|uniref:uncharacterized protein n=1 Tax=Watersipora subatra TaxID=2589382 RepID=UPI00355ADDBC
MGLSSILFICEVAGSLAGQLEGESETIHSNLASESAYICRGSLQLDLLDPEKLLVGVKTISSGLIGNLALSDLTQPLSILYGNSSALPVPPDLFVDGIGAEARLVLPTDLYQTEDKSRILFVDNNSCAREIDRSSRNVTTVIGQGRCDSGTLDMFNASRLISGMIYYERKDMWLFSIFYKGLYAYERDSTGTYAGRLLVDLQLASHSPPFDLRQVYMTKDIIWNKVRYGLNIYNLTVANSTAQLKYDNSSFIRILSSTGLSEAADPTAWYRYGTQEQKLGDADADISLSPDGKTLLVADLAIDRIFLFSINNGDLQDFCSKEENMTVSLIDGTGEICTFHELEAGLWLDDYTVLVAERMPSQFRKLKFFRADLESTSIGAVPPLPTPYKKVEEGTWWIVLVVSIGFCAPLFIFWIAVKIVQCRRHGIAFDIFMEEEESLDPLAARNINFLYNKASKGQEYTKPAARTSKKRSLKDRRKKSVKDKKENQSQGFASAAEYITDKFQLPRKKKKKPVGDGMEEVLHPLPKPAKNKTKKSKRSSIDIDFQGSTVSVPMTKMSVGRARPLPSLPLHQTV